MTTRYLPLLIMVVVAASAPAYAQESHNATAGKQESKPGGYVLERDKDVARDERLFVFQQDPESQAGLSQARLQAWFGDRISPAARGRDLLRAQRPRHDDDRRQGIRGRSRRRGVDPARQLARPEADRQRGSRHFDQLRAGAETLAEFFFLKLVRGVIPT